MADNLESEWEDVASPAMGDYTERLKVPGGWLYRNWIENQPETSIALALVFVPDPRS